jgi:membrane-associated protease RseP (regulator of RpoE activity)
MEQASDSIRPEDAQAAQLIVVAQLKRHLAGLMRIDAHEVLRQPDEVVVFRGLIEGDTEEAFEQITQRFADAGYTAWLRDGAEGGHEVVASKGELDRRTGRVWVNVVLFFGTLLTVLYFGALNNLDTSLIQDPESLEVLFAPLRQIHRGLPFAATFMGILLAHELSHYLVGRLYGSPQSLPYFIPFPNPLFGTMGALILQRRPIRSRKALLDIGIAGPLGGLIVAIPLLILGLMLSEVGPPPAEVEAAIQEGNSLLYAGIKFLVFGRFLPSGNEDVWLHPVAFGAWGGLFITMLNLVPIGQLDGGHVSYALLGRRARTVGTVAIGALVAWGGWLVLNGNAAGGTWITWAILNLVLNRRHPPLLDDATKLDLPRVVLGLFLLAIFALLFMPAPLQEVVF